MWHVNAHIICSVCVWSGHRLSGDLGSDTGKMWSVRYVGKKVNGIVFFLNACGWDKLFCEACCVICVIAVDEWHLFSVVACGGFVVLCVVVCIVCV